MAAKNPADIKYQAIAWYENPGEYAMALAIMEDAADFPPTWEAWKAAAEQEVAAIEAAGIRPIMVPISAEGFQMHITNKKLLANAETRSRYIAGAAYMHHMATWETYSADEKGRPN